MEPLRGIEPRSPNYENGASPQCLKGGWRSALGSNQTPFGASRLAGASKPSLDYAPLAAGEGIEPSTLRLAQFSRLVCALRATRQRRAAKFTRQYVRRDDRLERAAKFIGAA